MTKIYKVGIIGLGVGIKHYQSFESFKNVNVTSICDFDQKKLKILKKKNPRLKIIKNASDLIKSKDIDIVSIASYDSYHFDQVILSLQMNKHVFVEKPICLYQNELEVIRKLLKKKRKLYFSSNMNLRTSSIFKQLKNSARKKKIFYIEADYNSGRLSKITNGWRTKEKYHSIILSSAVHVIDLVCWILNDYPKSVFAYGNKIITKKSKFKYDDFFIGIMKFSNNIISKVSANIGGIYPHFHKLSLYTDKYTFENSIKGSYFIKKKRNGLIFKNENTNYKDRKRGLLIKEFVEEINQKKSGENKKKFKEIYNIMKICFAFINSLKKSKKINMKYVS